jgi:integrase
VGNAITEYLSNADFRQLSAASQRQYRWALDFMRDRVGHVLIADIDTDWVEKLRDKMASDAIRWNSIRSRMREVFKLYRRRRPELLPINPWEEVHRLKVPHSVQNRRWPDAVITQVFREATPEFRALMIILLLTAQRIGDVVVFERSQYDEDARVLSFAQQKTGKRIALHVPEVLAEIFRVMSDRDPTRLLVTPRGKPWTKVNAEETLLSLRARLEIPRYTLHGLRATGPQALKMLGLENRAIRSLTGHDSDRNLEVYLQGVDEYPMARRAQEMLGERFDSVLRQSLRGANTRKFSGVTGRAARKIDRSSTVSAEGTGNVAAPVSVKPVQNAK